MRTQIAPPQAHCLASRAICLQAKLEEEEQRAAQSNYELCARLDSLGAEYDATLAALRAAEEERARLKAQCDSVRQELQAEHERRLLQARAQSAELSAREAQLEAALVDSRTKATMLSTVLNEQRVAESAVSSLHEKLAEAERAALASERRLRRLEAELQLVHNQRTQLEAELAILSKLVADELADSEAERLKELERLIQEARTREHELEEQKALIKEQHQLATQEVTAAKALLRSEQEKSNERNESLWQRLKRQAIVQAAEMKLLRESLNQTEAERRAALASAEMSAQQSRVALSEREAKLAGLRGSLRAANQVSAGICVACFA